MSKIVKHIVLPFGEKLWIYDDKSITIRDIDGEEVSINKQSISAILEELQKLI